MIRLPLSQITDQSIRASLEQIQDSINDNPLNLGDFKLFEIITTAAVTNRVIAHPMGIIPVDIIVTRITGGTVTWAYDSFTKSTIQLTTSAAVRIRVLMGSIGEANAILDV